MKVAFIVQRYGEEVCGGAEHLCRQIAERMATHWDVEVLSTCAVDYVTWKDEYPPGPTRVRDVAVRRFPVDAPRDTAAFGVLCNDVLTGRHRLQPPPVQRTAELAWMRAQGPYSTPLIDWLRHRGRDYDFVVFFTYLYASTYFGMPHVADRCALVPTAHDEPPIYLDIFREVFATARALVFSTPEEREFVNLRFGTAATPQDVVGVGVEIPRDAEPTRFLAQHAEALEGRPFVLYAGRVDAAKSCQQLFDHFMRLREDAFETPLKLVLVGTPAMPIPEHPDIVPLGFVSEREKVDAIAAARVVVQPSVNESLSLVALEAWALGTPVLVNGRCAVLRNQCIRSNGGLWYDDYPEFREALRMLAQDETLRLALGAAGRAFVERTCRWTQIEAKYRALITRAVIAPASALGDGLRDDNE